MKAALDSSVKNEYAEFSDEAKKIANKATLNQVASGNWKNVNKEIAFKDINLNATLTLVNLGGKEEYYIS